MDKFRTEITIEQADELISYDSRLLFMGSCFASNIGSYFTSNGLNALVNPFGVLYNPFSIARSLERMIRRQSFTDDDILLHNGAHHTFYHHSQFNHVDKEKFLDAINTSLTTSAAFLEQADMLIITFGTSWVYQHNELGMVVSNCHKYPARDFTRYRLSVADIVSRYRQLLTTIRECNPNLRVIFTVSPVRHWKDGAHGNQLSKATLLLAIEQLIQECDFATYFPAYELLLDDLRDYRFFADDMLHPSDKAVEYIREKFIESQFDAEAKSVLAQLSKLIQAAKHRPFNQSSGAHQTFVRNHIKKVEDFQAKYPALELSRIQESFKEQMI
ncbi:GSCFA domain-containing protein [Carboxylicivirga mesophila]|uniref:GSCFA domain-containing protein n=1 Tax=Carboxylicivirga mesophila TaxID=1166478 RepID=A0ABS5K5M2_9BACT|nr:GSCFA domain-containing protein [Carboxylicivirga mesophila]MBS2210251.1 GSCFA domain-containing protein [Carboxylicivirga mesophila]